MLKVPKGLDSSEMFYKVPNLSSNPGLTRSQFLIDMTTLVLYFPLPIDWPTCSNPFFITFLFHARLSDHSESFPEPMTIGTGKKCRIVSSSKSWKADRSSRLFTACTVRFLCFAARRYYDKARVAYATLVSSWIPRDVAGSAITRRIHRPLD